MHQIIIIDGAQALGVGVAGLHPGGAMVLQDDKELMLGDAKNIWAPEQECGVGEDGE